MMRAKGDSLRILAIIPVRNRRESTLRFLTSLAEIDKPENTSLNVLVIDDGSTDGTSDAIQSGFPDVTLIEADGSLYWSGAIQLGLVGFLKQEYDYAWLLNDDIVVTKSCLRALLAVAQRFPGRVYSGTVEDVRGEIIYGGITRRPGFRFRKIGEADYEDSLAFTETLNGNCALLSRHALQLFAWPRPGTYVHEGFDMFIGLEASRNSVGPVIVRDAVCIGERNDRKFWFFNRSHSLSDRLKGVIDLKGIYPPMYWDMCRRFGGFLYPLYFVRPYIHAFFGKK